MKDISQSLEKKSIILRGGTLESRRLRLKEAVEKLTLRGWNVIVFPEHISGGPARENFKNILPVLPISSPIGIDKYKMSFTQLHDFFLEWVHTQPKTVIVFSEISPEPVEKLWSWLNVYLEKTFTSNYDFIPGRQLRILITLNKRIEMNDVLQAAKDWLPKTISQINYKNPSLAPKREDVVFDLSEYLEVIG